MALTITNSDPSTNGSPRPSSTEAARQSAPVRFIARPMARTRTGDNRRVSRPLSWAAAMMPSELTPKASENPCGLSP